MKVSWIEDRADAELVRAWIELVDPVALHEGECWQYMATEFDDAKGGGWQHVFRHRNHPATGDVMFVRVPAHRRWRPSWFQEVD
ncbi:MAG TPA: hypothetical protein VIT21_03655 [Chthoniobacterales bacterium]